MTLYLAIVFDDPDAASCFCGMARCLAVQMPDLYLVRFSSRVSIWTNDPDGAVVQLAMNYRARSIQKVPIKLAPQPPSPQAFCT